MNASTTSSSLLSLLCLTLGATHVNAFVLSSNDFVVAPFNEVPYGGTFTLPGHGSTSCLFLDIDPASLDPGDRVTVSLWRDSIGVLDTGASRNENQSDGCLAL